MLSGLFTFLNRGITAFSISILVCIIAAHSFASDVQRDAAAIVQAVDLYWISFGGSLDTDPVYVMQIDQTGRVTKAPKKLLVASQFGSDKGATALGKNGPGKLNLWIMGHNNTLYRAVLGTNPLGVLGLTKTGLVGADSDGLQATQKSTANFLTIEEGANVLMGEAVGTGGLPTGTRWSLSPGAPNLNDEGSVAADGLAATTNRNGTTAGDKLYFQKLAANGRASGSPQLMASFTNIESNDVTSALVNGNRYVGYVVVNLANKLFLQKVNSNGGKIGSAILINTPPGRDQDDQTVALDPLGRFVVFTISGKNYSCAGHDVLVYQALDATAHTSGSLKLLAKCGLVGDDIENINILKQ